MQVQLTQKERMLLEDMKKEEELCIMKYNSYAQQATDPALQQMFNQIANVEHEHFDTINQILQGNQPNTGQSKGGQTAKSGQSGQINLGQSQGTQSNSSDKYLLQDMLSTEKYVSSSYNTSIFECTKPNIRQALQHIQQEEQNHGEQLFQYMNSHGMYQPQ
ncbi:MAG: spore coat protein [Eubacteriales bacterium]|nr:spore coat protein [Eubacteriales bacterium]